MFSFIIILSSLGDLKKTTLSVVCRERGNGICLHRELMVIVLCGIVMEVNVRDGIY